MEQIGISHKWLTAPTGDSATGRLIVEAVLFGATPANVKYSDLNSSLLFANTLQINTDEQIQSLLGMSSASVADKARAVSLFRAFFDPLGTTVWKDDVRSTILGLFNSKINGIATIGALNTNLNFTQWLLTDTKPNVYARMFHKKAAFKGRNGVPEFCLYINELFARYTVSTIKVPLDYIYQTYDGMELDIQLIVAAADTIYPELKNRAGFAVIIQLNTLISRINDYRIRLRTLIYAMYDYSVQQVAGKFGI